MKGEKLMLFWIFVGLVVAGSVLLWAYNNTSAGEWTLCTGSGCLVFGIIAVGISLLVMMSSLTNTDGQVAEYNARYDMLTYQLENDIYENDNDLGKRELMTDIQAWNEDIAYWKEAQDDFWIGIYVPDIYDQFKPIELGAMD